MELFKLSRLPNQKKTLLNVARGAFTLVLVATAIDLFSNPIHQDTTSRPAPQIKSLANQPPAVQSVFDKLNRKDWGAIYAMASDSEKRKMGLTQEQYVRLNQVIAEGFPKDLQCKFYDLLKAKTDWYTMIFKFQAAGLAPDISQSTHGSLLGMDLIVTDGLWYPQISKLPFDLLAHRQEPKKARYERLLRAMQEAGIQELVVADPINPSRTFTRASLKTVIDGELAPPEAF